MQDSEVIQRPLRGASQKHHWNAVESFWDHLKPGRNFDIGLYRSVDNREGEGQVRTGLMIAMIRECASRIGPLARVLAFGILAGGVFASSALACNAETEHIRRQEGYALGLPDCRAYEQVSPVAKNGADAFGEADTVKASRSGGAVTFWSMSPFLGEPGSHIVSLETPHLSSRLVDSHNWSTQGLLPATDVQNAVVIGGSSEDLARTIEMSGEPALAEGAAKGPEVRNAYVRDNATGIYQLLAANVGNGSTLYFADATPNGRRILFETAEQLSTSNGSPVSGVVNLYEWNEARPSTERLSLVGLVPSSGKGSCNPSGPVCEPPVGGSVAGPGGPSVAPLFPGGSSSFLYTQHTISEDGSLIFFTDLTTGFIYERKPTVGETVRVSAGTEPAYWRAATPSGSFVFYTEGAKLYRYNSATSTSEALTSGTEGKGLLGALGVSNDGSYVYIVSEEVLASNERKPGVEVEKAVSGADNLYEWHDGEVSFIARLEGSRAGGDETDWVNGQGGAGLAEQEPGGGGKSSRVAPDGREVLFSSVRRLTAYDNAGMYELYLYNAGAPASSSNPVCVSCNSRGTTAKWNTFLSLLENDRPVGPQAQNSILARNLSNDGGRAFFETREALVPAASNDRMNVYEWERKGDGTCASASVSFVASSGGCLYLISTGQSASNSYFADASENGEDVFFFTRQSLVGQDQDPNEDVYDAHVEGGIVAQNPVSATPCADEETCRGEPEVQPAFGAPSSSLLSGSGNLAPPLPATTKVVTKVKCPKGKRLNHGACVKVKPRKRKARGSTRSRPMNAGRRG
jgi:hypothetical protein